MTHSFCRYRDLTCARSALPRPGWTESTSFPQSCHSTPLSAGRQPGECLERRVVSYRRTISFCVCVSLPAVTRQK